MECAKLRENESQPATKKLIYSEASHEGPSRWTGILKKFFDKYPGFRVRVHGVYHSAWGILCGSRECCSHGLRVQNPEPLMPTPSL